MANWNSINSTIRLSGNGTSALTAITSYVNSVQYNGGPGLVDDTGHSDTVRSEAYDVGPVNVLVINGFYNSTTEAILGPCLNGTAVAKTVEWKPFTGRYYSGTALVGPVSVSSPIGLQTFSLELHSNSGTGFNRTSVAL